MEGLRNTRRVQSLRILEPGVGQVQPHRQRVMALGADGVHRGGHRAIGLLAQGPAILPLDADGVPPLLGEAGVVEDKDPFGAGEGLGQVLSIASAELRVVPGAPVDELLEGLLRVLNVQVRRKSDATGERLDALAFAVMGGPWRETRSRRPASCGRIHRGTRPHNPEVARGLRASVRVCKSCDNDHTTKAPKSS